MSNRTDWQILRKLTWCEPVVIDNTLRLFGELWTRFPNGKRVPLGISMIFTKIDRFPIEMRDIINHLESAVLSIRDMLAEEKAEII